MGRLLVMFIAASMCAACASTGAVYAPHPFPKPGGNSGSVAIAAPVEPGSTVEGYALSGTALSLRGAPYRPGGFDPSGFDCSGFVHYVYEQHGVAMPRLVRDQFRIGQTIDRDRLEPGDLVFFSTVAPGASHVGIMIGGDQFVHAPSERGVVRVEHLNTPYWANRYLGAKRVS